MNPAMEGGCQCGAVRFRLTEAPRRVYACHCGECRRQSASAFGISAIVGPDGVELLRGEIRLWSRPTDSGGRLDCAFCAVCGSRLWHGFDGGYSVKGGALDLPPEPQSHIWVSRKLPWVILPDDVETWAEEPPR